MNKRFVGGMRAALFDSPLVTSRLSLALAEMLWAIINHHASQVLAFFLPNSKMRSHTKSQ